MPELSLTELLHLRAILLEETRRFFRDRGFLEVETPTLVPYPEATAQIRGFVTRLHGSGGGEVPLYLHSSPEHFMKRLLTAISPTVSNPWPAANIGSGVEGSMASSTSMGAHSPPTPVGPYILWPEKQ